MTVFPFSLYANDSTDMKATELLSLIQTGKSPVIVDVRSGVEYRAGHVPGAIHVPFWSAYWRADRIPASGHDPVVVYCAHGPRAGIAGWALKLAGIPNVVYLQGHMTGWQKQALPEVKGEKPD
jgi:hydroxyacylglutathione hydrolase